MRRPLPVGLSPRSGRSFAPAVIHPLDSSASRRGLRGHSRWPRGRRGITLPPEQRVVLPLLARVLRCAAPRLCCLPGCPSRPHRPHPLPHPLPLRLGPRHCRCRCLRHSRRRFPPPHPLRRRRLRCSRHHRRPPQLSLAHLPHTPTALRASPHAASAPPRPHDDLPPRPPRVSDLWPCSARGDSAPPSRARRPRPRHLPPRRHPHRRLRRHHPAALATASVQWWHGARRTTCRSYRLWSGRRRSRR